MPGNGDGISYYPLSQGKRSYRLRYVCYADIIAPLVFPSACSSAVASDLVKTQPVYSNPTKDLGVLGNTDADEHLALLDRKTGILFLHHRRATALLKRGRTPSNAAVAAGKPTVVNVITDSYTRVQTVRP
jgi:hypothetical protein